MLDWNTPAIDNNGDGDVDDTTTGPYPDTTAFDPTDPYVRIIDSTLGLHVAQDVDDFAANPQGNSYLYFEADFDDAFAQSQYTTRIILDFVSE